MSNYARHVFVLLSCALAGCSQSLPDYQPDNQPGVHIQERASRAHGATYFTTSGEDRPVFSIQASSPEGTVLLYVLGQQPQESGNSRPFQVLCKTAKLLSGKEAFAPRESEQQSAIPSEGVRVSSCVGKAVVNGNDKLAGVLLRFESGKGLGDRFSLVLPTIEFDSGQIIQGRIVTFSKRMLKELGGIR
jgi:hypothetical protein